MNFWSLFCSIQTGIIIGLIARWLSDASDTKKRLKTFRTNTDSLLERLDEANTTIETLDKENKIFRSAILKINRTISNVFGSSVIHFGIPDDLLDNIIKENVEIQLHNERIATNIAQFSYDLSRQDRPYLSDDIKKSIVDLHMTKFVVDYNNIEIKINAHNLLKLNQKCSKRQIININTTINGISKIIKIWA